MLFVAMPLVLSYHNELVSFASANDQPRVWMIALTEHVYMAGVAFFSNGKEGVCTGYYTHNTQLTIWMAVYSVVSR